MDPQLIDLIYESSFISERWPEALDKLAKMIEASMASFIVFNSKSNALWTASPGAASNVQRFVNEGWVFRGQFGAKLFGAPGAGFAVESDFFTLQELEEEPVYRDLFRPLGFGWGAGTVIRVPTGENIFVALNRRSERGPVERDFVRQLDALRPHIARSVLISARLQLERARAVSEALALIGLPALVLDEQGKVLAANDLIEALTSCVRWRAQDRVALKDGAADKLLREAIETFRRHDAQPIRSFPLRDADANAIMVAHILPIRRSARDIFVRSAAVLVITPVSAPHAPPVELVQSLFDLTPAEARVARSLASGKTVEDIASGGGVSVNTIRTHVRGVLEKTGCNRQAEVVALLTGILPLRA